MRIFLTAVVCLLLSFVSANTISNKSTGSAVLAASPAQINQCPPCTDSCELIGVTVNGYIVHQACSFTQQNGHVCYGQGDIFEFFGASPGRDMLKRIQVQCSGTNDVQQSCTGTTDSYEVISNVCCPVGQTQPHDTCNNGTCVSNNYCGVSNCETPNQSCGGYGEYSEACAELPESNGFAPGGPYPYCEYGYTPAGYAWCCVAISPIVIDVLGNGYNLTGTNNPVSFDFNGSGSPIAMSWTRANSDDAFLVLDRNGNRTIDNGAELFGNVTPQPLSSQKNGFLALAEYDKPSSGGNNDGKINRADAIYASLRLWQDTNHNGISEASELHRLPALNVVAIDLDYQESKRQDANGNLFRYRAKVRDAQGASVGRWAWDVFFVKQ